MNPELDTQPQPDEQLQAIAHTARRHLLIALRNGNPQEHTAIALDEWVDETDTAAPLTVMHHTHLPKLEDQGFIQWDRDHHRVSRGPQFAEIEPLLSVLYDHREDLPEEWW